VGTFKDIFGEQFRNLELDLTHHHKNVYSVKKMLAAFLKFIVETDRLQKDGKLRAERQTYINEIDHKTNALHSLWARLDGEEDPDRLDAAAARHVDRRRERALITANARAAFTLGEPDLAMPAVDAPFMPYKKRSAFFAMSTDAAAIAEMGLLLLGTHRLAFEETDGHDLFSALARAMYTKERIEEVGPDLAAKQLRALTAWQIESNSKTEVEREGASENLGVGFAGYMARLIDGTYSGDLYCLSLLSRHLGHSFRVWLPGIAIQNCRSILVQHSPEVPSTTYQLVLAGKAPAKAKGYSPKWYAVHFEPLVAAPLVVVGTRQRRQKRARVAT